MKSLCILFVLLLSVTGYSQANERRDGNWWLKNPRPAKAVYVLGFFDGIQSDISNGQEHDISKERLQD
jgi:hypothetical protein